MKDLQSFPGSSCSLIGIACNAKLLNSSYFSRNTVFIWLKINCDIFGGGGGVREEGETHMTAISDIWRTTFFIVGTPFPVWLLGMVSDGSPLPLFKKKYPIDTNMFGMFLARFSPSLFLYCRQQRKVEASANVDLLTKIINGAARNQLTGVGGGGGRPT